MVSQKSAGQNNSENQSTGSAIKLFSVELLILVILAIVVLGALNYFNILSLSQIFPRELGWLPHKSLSSISSKTSITPVLTKTPEGKLTPEQRMLSYGKEVLKPELVPLLLKDVKDQLQSDQKIYGADVKVDNNITIKFYYAESIKSSRFKEEGLPLGVNILVYENGNFFVTQENLQTYLEKYFINMPTTNPKSFKRFTAGFGPSVLEKVWDNQDNTKESRSTVRSYSIDSNGNPQNSVVFVACRIYKDSPLYEKNTCYREKN